MSNGHDPNTEVRFTPLGILTSLVLVVGLIGLGVHLIAPDVLDPYLAPYLGTSTPPTTVAQQTPPPTEPPVARVDTRPPATIAETPPSTAAPATTLPPARADDAPPPAERTGVLANVRRTGTLRVAMEPEAPPMNFVSRGGQRDGFDFQIAFDLAQRLGAKRVEIVEGDYDQLPELVATNKADVIMGGYVADPSIEGIAWSDGYLDFGLCLIVKQGSAIKEVKHLAGKKVGIYEDPAAKEWLESNAPSTRSIEEFQYTGWFKELDQGNVDAIVYDYPFAVEEIKPFPRLKIVKLNLNEAQYVVGVPVRNDDLYDAVNESITTLKASPEFEGWVKQYLATEAVETAPLAKGTKTYVVKVGDSLSSIARSQIGRADDWTKIWELNKGRLGNPHLIKVGFALVMP